MNFSPAFLESGGPFGKKFSCRLISVAEGQSRLRAAQALATLCQMPAPAAYHVIKNLPQLLCTLESETFRSVVLTREETETAAAALLPFFDFNFFPVSEDVLPFGNFGFDGSQSMPSGHATG